MKKLTIYIWCVVVKECVVAGGFASLESIGAILEMSQSLMYEMNVVPGCTALVCIACHRSFLVVLVLTFLY